MSNEFKTKVYVDLDLNDHEGLEDKAFTIDTKDMNLRWNLELEMRQFGIKSFIVTVPDQKITADISIWSEDEDIPKQITLEIKDVQIEMNQQEFFSLIPRSLTYSNKKWTLEF